MFRGSIAVLYIVSRTYSGVVDGRSGTYRMEISQKNLKSTGVCQHPLSYSFLFDLFF